MAIIYYLCICASKYNGWIVKLGNNIQPCILMTLGFFKFIRALKMNEKKDKLFIKNCNLRISNVPYR